MDDSKRWTEETREEQRARMKATRRWLNSTANKPGPRRQFSHQALADALSRLGTPAVEA